MNILNSAAIFSLLATSALCASTAPTPFALTRTMPEAPKPVSEEMCKDIKNAQQFYQKMWSLLDGSKDKDGKKNDLISLFNCPAAKGYIMGFTKSVVQGQNADIVKGALETLVPYGSLQVDHDRTFAKCVEYLKGQVFRKQLAICNGNECKITIFKERGGYPCTHKFMKDQIDAMAAHLTGKQPGKTWSVVINEEKVPESDVTANKELEPILNASTNYEGAAKLEFNKIKESSMLNLRDKVKELLSPDVAVEQSAANAGADGNANANAPADTASKDTGMKSSILNKLSTYWPLKK